MRLKPWSELKAGMSPEAQQRADEQTRAILAAEPSVPLSAIRALVQQWDKDCECWPPFGAGACAIKAIRKCMDDLAALCPAPPEDHV
jgi:hypothetical protein